MLQHTGSVDLSGKVALVTDVGTAFGRAMAQALVRAGAYTHVVTRTYAEWNTRLVPRQPQEAVVQHMADLRDGFALDCLATELKEQLPVLHVLVSNARIPGVPRSRGLTDVQAQAAEHLRVQDHVFLVQELLAPLRDAAQAGAPANAVCVGSRRPSAPATGGDDADAERALSALFPASTVRLHWVAADSAGQDIHGPGSVVDAVLRCAASGVAAR